GSPEFRLGPDRRELQMGRLKRFGSSPALIVAGLAIAIAITTTAVAGPQAIISAINKKEKKQVKNISNQQITNRAPGLSVSSAKTAGNGYLGYARISATGTVSQAKNIAAANVTHPVAGAYCFNGLPFDLQNVQASADANGTASEIMVE